MRDVAYFRNFAEIAKQLASDGQLVRQVGFTVVRDGEERHVGLTTPGEGLLVPDDETESGAQVMELQGQLKGAEDIKEHRIRLEDEGKPSPWISVPAGMMADIVRPMWDELVVVTAAKTQKGLVLKSIRRRNSE